MVAASETCPWGDSITQSVRTRTSDVERQQGASLWPGVVSRRATTRPETGSASSQQRASQIQPRRGLSTPAKLPAIAGRGPSRPPQGTLTGEGVFRLPRPSLHLLPPHRPPAPSSTSLLKVGSVGMTTTRRGNRDMLSFSLRRGPSKRHKRGDETRASEDLFMESVPPATAAISFIRRQPAGSNNKNFRRS